MRQILNSWDVNVEVHDIAETNCLPEHKDLIKHYYWENDYRYNIKYSLYKEKNKISKESIVRSLIK